jgi:hypothetical protein
MMVLIAALGGPGAVSCSIVEHMDGYTQLPYAVNLDGAFKRETGLNSTVGGAGFRDIGETAWRRSAAT